MLRSLLKRWFLIALAVLIPGGLLIGARLPATRIEDLEGVVGSATSLLVMAVLFLMSVTLDNRQLRAALTRPGPVVWATVVTFVFMPLVAWPLSRLQLVPDFAVGLMIAASVPCTMAAASVWTRKAGGNDAVSLLVTIVTNGLCFAVTPFWMRVSLAGIPALATAVTLDVWQMMRDLFIAALLPIAVGQALRLVPACAALADRHKVGLGVTAQICILAIVLWTSLKAGPKLHVESGPALTVPSVVWVWACCIALHTAALHFARYVGRAFGFSDRDLIAVAFAASQKTLPIGVLIATDPSMFGNRGVPFAVFPMLMYHASQLFIDTWVADRIAADRGRETAAADAV